MKIYKLVFVAVLLKVQTLMRCNHPKFDRALLPALSSRNRVLGSVGTKTWPKEQFWNFTSKIA